MPVEAQPEAAVVEASGVPGYLSIRDLRKEFDGFVAVDDVNLDVRKGEIFALLGGSGSGKSTLLRCLGGFETPTKGSITVDGQRLDARRDGDHTLLEDGIVCRVRLHTTICSLPISASAAMCPQASRSQRDARTGSSNLSIACQLKSLRGGRANHSIQPQAHPTGMQHFFSLY